MTLPPSELLHALRTGDNFLVTSHVRPDGDAIGSMAALGHVLRTLGKNFFLFNESGLPEAYSWVDMPAVMQTSIPESGWDWIIVLDSSNALRAGEYIAGLVDHKAVINIDHHPDNPGFGLINWVDPGFSSVGEMIALLAREMELDLTGSLAQGIYLAIVSDTGFFSFGNTTPGVLELSARLIRSGLDNRAINPLITNQWSRGRMHLHGSAMQQAEFIDRGHIALICISRDMLRQTGTGPEDCQGLVNMLLKVQGVRVAATLREDESRQVKLSLRSAGPEDVRAIAREFGGGGHYNASGGIVLASLQEAREMLINTCRRHLG